MRTYKFVYQSLFFTFLWLGLSSASIGDDRFWIGGDLDWRNSNVGVGARWTGFDEPDPDDVAIFNTNNVVPMSDDNEVAGVTLSNSVRLSTEEFFLDVNGDVQLTGSGTTLDVAGNNLTVPTVHAVDAHNLIINSGARVNFGGDIFNVNDPGSTTGVFDINAGGLLTGNGFLRGGDAGPSDVFLINDGTITVADSPRLLPILGSVPTPRSLLMGAAGGGAEIDLDGSSGNGQVNIPRNQNLRIVATLSDAFGGSLTMGHDSKLTIELPWAIDGGTTTINNGFQAESPPFIPFIPAGNATIAGATLTQTGGTIDVTSSTGTLTLEADFTGSGGTIDNIAGGTVVFQGTTSIQTGHDYQLGSNAQTIVDGGTTTIEDDNLDFDGVASNADWTVANDGVLNVFKQSINGSGSNVLSGDLYINDGLVNVNVDGTNWTSNNRIESNGGGKLIGDTVLIGNNVGPANADVDVNSGTLRISARANFLSDANVNVAAGATLIVDNPDTVFNPVDGANNGMFEGAGTLLLRGARFAEKTTFDFSDGTVGLDGLVGTNAAVNQVFRPAADTDIEAHLTINAASFDDFGTQGVALPSDPQTFSDVNILDKGRLEINLPDEFNDSWTLLPNATINYVGVGALDTFLAGARINLEGTLNVVGLGRSEASMDIDGTVNLQGESTRWHLGDSLTVVETTGVIIGDGSIVNESREVSPGVRFVNNLNIREGASIEVPIENNGRLNMSGASGGSVGHVQLQSLTQTNLGSVTFDLGAAPVADSLIDRISLAESASLDGSLRFELFTSDLIDAYDTVELISTGTGVSGFFRSVGSVGVGGTPGIIPDGQGLAVTYTANTVDLTLALLGDTNLDQTVDVLTDGFTFVGNLGMSGKTWADGDFNGDGRVDVLGDGFGLVGNLGTSFSPEASPSSFAVPEPTATTLLTLAGIFAWLPRKRGA